jgi:glutamate 5-kinase
MKEEGRSLLAIGVSEVQGDFGKGDIVSVRTQDSIEVARGLSNYSSEQIRKIRGCRSDRIEQILGQCPYDEIIHRDNLAII